jgi:hypothetical protein
MTVCDGDAGVVPPLVNQMHVAFRIQVAVARSADSFSEALAWDSGMVSGDGLRQTAGAVTAPPGVLQIATPYTWRVRVWASAGCASSWSPPAKFVVR